MAQNRYKGLIYNGKVRYIPLCTFSRRQSDKFEVFKKGVTTMDKLSYKYYGDVDYQWIIMMANQGYGSLEYEIPDGAVIRIPYPIDDVLNEYNNKINIALNTQAFTNN